jgi:hypothetical protein
VSSIFIHILCLTRFHNILLVALCEHQPKTADEQSFGQFAIKRWVLLLGWQRASYLHEPRHGPDGGLIGIFCDAFERIA